MNRYRLKAWTGPTAVAEMVDRLFEAGVYVTVGGTEHVYLEASGVDVFDAGQAVIQALQRRHGKDFGLRPVVISAQPVTDQTPRYDWEGKHGH